MEVWLIIIICVFTIIILKTSLNIKYKQLRKFKTRGTEELRNIAKSFPKDEKICTDILNKLNLSNVKVKIDEENSNCLYTVFNNAITIGKFKEPYMKLQTIAHECIHASQEKRILWSNFIFSNIYNVYFFVLLILAIFNKISNPIMYIYILTFMGLIQYIIRSYLENDAMIKAKYLSKDYLENNKICSEEEKMKLLDEYNDVNKIGIPFLNYSIIQSNLIKIVVCCIGFII